MKASLLLITVVASKVRVQKVRKRLCSKDLLKSVVCRGVIPMVWYIECSSFIRYCMWKKIFGSFVLLIFFLFTVFSQPRFCILSIFQRSYFVLFGEKMFTFFHSQCLLSFNFFLIVFYLDHALYWLIWLYALEKYYNKKIAHSK